MEDIYGFFNRGIENRRSSRNEEFDEEEIWAVARERSDASPKSRRLNRISSTSSSSAPRHVPTAARPIPKLNSWNDEGRDQHSAPVNIPDWSKIYRKHSSYHTHAHRDGSWAGPGDDFTPNGDLQDDDDDDDDEDDKVPPHEWLAKKLARNQISSFSVCEGAGRTLKGRDLSRVRNAVLTRTGFLE